MQAQDLEESIIKLFSSFKKVAVGTLELKQIPDILFFDVEYEKVFRTFALEPVDLKTHLYWGYFSGIKIYTNKE